MRIAPNPTYPLRVYGVHWWLQCGGLWLLVLLTLTSVGLVATRIIDLREGYDPNPWLTYWQSIAATFSDVRQLNDWFLYVINWVDLGFTTFALVLTALAAQMAIHQRFRWSLTLYLGCALLFLLSMAGPAVVIPLWSMSRWVGSLFPLFLVMAQLTESRLGNRLMFAFSSAVLVFFTAWWASGRWVA